MEMKVVMKDPKKSDYFYEESIKTLRTNIQFLGKQTKIILFTSCYPNEGKSDVAFTLSVEMGKTCLLYTSFAQRESLMYNRTVLFDEDFYGWKYGPVLKSVRHEYLTDSRFSDVEESVSLDTEKMLRDVLERYGTVSSWKLSSLSHDEFSWKKARKGLKSSDNGNVKMSLNAMMVDATHELAVRKAQGKR